MTDAVSETEYAATSQQKHLCRAPLDPRRRELGKGGPSLSLCLDRASPWAHMEYDVLFMTSNRY